MLHGAMGAGHSVGWAGAGYLRLKSSYTPMSSLLNILYAHFQQEYDFCAYRSVVLWLTPWIELVFSLKPLTKISAIFNKSYSHRTPIVGHDRAQLFQLGARHGRKRSESERASARSIWTEVFINLDSLTHLYSYYPIFYVFIFNTRPRFFSSTCPWIYDQPLERGQYLPKIFNK